MTSWQVYGMAFGLGAYAVAWIRGGRPERFGASVLILNSLISVLTYRWQVGGFHLSAILESCVCLVAFAWLCFRSDRWWPIVMTGAMGLMLLTHIVRHVDPAVSQYAAASARVGLWHMADLTLLLGVWERRLAGEPPASRAAWAAAARATAARRARRMSPGRDAPPVGNRARRQTFSKTP